jgi:hypothetical protein
VSAARALAVAAAAALDRRADTCAGALSPRRVLLGNPLLGSHLLAVSVSRFFQVAGNYNFASSPPSSRDLGRGEAAAARALAAAAGVMRRRATCVRACPRGFCWAPRISRTILGLSGADRLAVSKSIWHIPEDRSGVERKAIQDAG